MKMLNSIFKCRSCSSKFSLVSIIKTDFPLYIWPMQETEQTRLEDINVHICNDCGYIQLQNIDNQTLSEIYRDKAFNIENKSQNINRYKTLISKNQSKFNDAKVLEVGGGRNSFIYNLPSNSNKWVADFNIQKELFPILNGFYIGDFLELEINQIDFDYVVMFHVLEHFNNPGLALKKIRNLLKANGRLIIEVPNFAFFLKQKPYYSIFHMHISMFTKDTLLSLLFRNGFKCIDFFRADDVLFAEFALGDYKVSKNLKDNSLNYLYELKAITSKSYLILEKYFKKISNHKIAIFGAGGSATLFLYNFPFLIEKISYALDNDINKVGKYLCNGKVPIISPANDLEKTDYVIVLDENHIQFIKIKNVKIINITKIISKELY